MTFKELEFYEYLYENVHDIGVITKGQPNGFKSRSLSFVSDKNFSIKDFSFALLLHHAIMSNDVDYISDDKNQKNQFENKYDIYDKMCNLFVTLDPCIDINGLYFKKFLNSFNIDAKDTDNETMTLLKLAFDTVKTNTFIYDAVL